MITARRKRRLFAGMCLACTILCAALGIWQVERLAWKRDLIARVDARVHAAPVPPPPRSQWPTVSAARDEYRHVILHGTFAAGGTTYVDALTERGAGVWVLTPLVTSAGTVLVNRGFVAAAQRAAFAQAPAPAGPQTVTGLLRLSEPGGRFLRPNDPALGRWFSRDVTAIARAHGLAGVAPFFVDADAAGDPRAMPLGGLTVVRFRNAHLVYAVTWFALATLALAGLVLVARSRQEPA